MSKLSLLEEYFSVGILDEALQCVEELKSPAYHPEVVKETISLGTGKEPTMCGTVIKEVGALFMDQFGIDLPKAPNNFGEVIAGVLDLKVVQEVLREEEDDRLYRGVKLEGCIGPSPPLPVPTGEVCVGSGVGVVASVLSLVMEFSQDIVAGEGFRADDGAAGVDLVPVAGFTLPETGSSSPVASEGGVVPSSDFGLPVVNNTEDSSTTLFVPATPAISPFIPEWAVNVELVFGSPEVSVAGLESLGFGDQGESSVQGSGSVSMAKRLSQVKYPDFPLSWEDDLAVSPSSRVQEGLVSGEVVSVVVPGSEESLAKATWGGCFG
ncbi:hypothetical protein FH972_013038 [Carpinus fangiana]|uniref:MI domain-containing protein n=1 Tax=Carpinus fangiana TaxID=176857 RepID=A0A5N6R5G7_9ROSI|nr:hypothetical protein FH972_013038 [Carpinus fangiana]